MENATISGTGAAQRSDNNNQGSAIEHKQRSGGIDSFLDRRGKQWSVPGKLRKDLPMSKSISLVAAAIVSLVVGLGAATSGNAQSPQSDQAYCHSLVKVLKEGTGTVRGLPVGNATAVAIGQCEEGNPGPAIPVLEQQLRDADIPVPARG
jgi:hypothetical protein